MIEVFITEMVILRLLKYVLKKSMDLIINLHNHPQKHSFGDDKTTTKIETKQSHNAHSENTVKGKLIIVVVSVTKYNLLGTLTCFAVIEMYHLTFLIYKD